MAEAKKSSLDKLAEVKVTKVSKVDYKNLESIMDGGEELYVVKNTLDTPFVIDWNLELLPADMEEEFDNHLQKKYVEYGQDNALGKTRMIALFVDGRTVNFLDSFLASKRMPVIMPRSAGKEDSMKSSFVINAGQEIIITKKQAEALRGFEKVKKVWTESDGRVESPWLGFLILTPIKSLKDLVKYSISYVTYKDAVASHEDIKVTESSHQKQEGNIIRATE